MSTRFSALLVVCFVNGSMADEGELSVGAETTPGWLWISNQSLKSDGFSSSFIQRFSLPVTYGLTDIWSIGINPGFSLSYKDIVFNNVNIQGMSGNLHSDLFWLTVPLQTSFRVNTGTNWSTTFEFFGGYSAMVWKDRFLEKDGFLVLGESELSSRWLHGAMFGGQILFETRIKDWLLIQAGPSMTATNMDGWGFFPGISIRISGIFGVGSGFSARAE